MTNNALTKFIAVLAHCGLKEAIRRAYDYLKFKKAINARRRQLALQIAKLYNWEVAFGPFKGMRISQLSWWGQTDLASKILGFYEHEILESLIKINKKQYQNFIDLGAADGYYAIGLTHAQLFSKATCFELSEQGRDVIQKNANLNHVSEKISIFGYADENFDRLIPEVDLSESVVLIDIEGGEFTLLTDRLVDKLKHSLLIIELHEFMVEDGEVKLDALIGRLSQFFNITWLTTGPRDLSSFEALKNLNDTDRWIICSEGRTQLQRWIVCEPLSS